MRRFRLKKLGNIAKDDGEAEKWPKPCPPHSVSSNFFLSFIILSWSIIHTMPKFVSLHGHCTLWSFISFGARIFRNRLFFLFLFLNLICGFLFLLSIYFTHLSFVFLFDLELKFRHWKFESFMVKLVCHFVSFGSWVCSLISCNVIYLLVHASVSWGFLFLYANMAFSKSGLTSAWLEM